jgi:hypothetical protein
MNTEEKMRHTLDRMARHEGYAIALDEVLDYLGTLDFSLFSHNIFTSTGALPLCLEKWKHLLIALDREEEYEQFLKEIKKSGVDVYE